MIATGKFNTITGQEIIQIEEHDFDWNKNWNELTLDEKANFCSFIKQSFLTKSIEHKIIEKYNFYQSKNLKK